MNIISTLPVTFTVEENIIINDNQLLLQCNELDAIVELEDLETVGTVSDELRAQNLMYILFVRYVDYTSNLNDEQLIESSFYSTAPSGMAFKRECVCSIKNIA